MSAPKKTINKNPRNKNTSRQEPMALFYSPSSPPPESSSPRYSPSDAPLELPSHNADGCSHSIVDEIAFLKQHWSDFRYEKDQKMFVAMFPTLFCAYEMYTEEGCTFVEMYGESDQLEMGTATQLDTAILAQYGEFTCTRTMYGVHAGLSSFCDRVIFTDHPYITPFFSVEKVPTGMGFCAHQPTKVTYRSHKVHIVHKALSKAFIANY
jgi:hypothetical protein